MGTFAWSIRRTSICFLGKQLVGYLYNTKYYAIQYTSTQGRIGLNVFLAFCDVSFADDSMSLFVMFSCLPNDKSFLQLLFAQVTIIRRCIKISTLSQL